MQRSNVGAHHEPFPARVWVIANPTAGGHRRQKRLNAAISFLQSNLPISVVRQTQCRGDAERWARESVANKVALLIGSGGDGTVNEIANGLAGSDVALGILPAGTSNVVACELGIPRDPVEAARGILGGQVERLHLGCAEYSPLANVSPDVNGVTGERATRYFLFAAGLGFDACVCHRVHRKLRRWGRKATFFFDGLCLLTRYRSPRLHVTLDGGAPTVCCELIVSKASSYAGRFCLAPEASLRKPDLDARLFLRPGRWNLLRYAWGIVRSRITIYSDVLCRKAQSIEVAADGVVYLQLDGDTVGRAPVRFTVRRDALSVVVPPTG